jgi:hypothetical protein
MPSAVTPAWLLIGAGVLTGLGAILFASGWLMIGGLMLLLATPLDGIADRLAALRLERRGQGSWPARALPYLAGAALLALSYQLAGTRGMGYARRRRCRHRLPVCSVARDRTAAPARAPLLR